ncbi:hypothetical protein D3C84_1012310 [compost metagenome]
MCGKSIKKVINKVVDLDPLRGGDVILEGLGLPSLMGENTGMLNKSDRDKAAAKAAEAAAGSVASTATAPTTSSDSVQSAVDAERRRRLAQSGQNGTILTGSSGLSGGANTNQKTLLGV